jgi:drug/metabolite transporter (DMT)-like permease
MSLYYGAMLLTVVSNVGYHVCQRSISAKVNPLVSLLITYGVAALAALIALPFFPADGAPSWTEQLRAANWASFALGAAIVGLELGFLLAYRAGWRVSVAALYSNAAVTILLVPVGLLAFHERLDARRVLGLALAGGGLWLLGAR